jgi:hypothetical protein
MTKSQTVYVKEGRRYVPIGTEWTWRDHIPNGEYIAIVKDGRKSLRRIPNVNLGFAEIQLAAIEDLVAKRVVDLVMSKTHSAFDVGQAAIAAVREFLMGEEVKA